VDGYILIFHFWVLQNGAKPFQGYFFQSKFTLGDRLFLMGQDRGPGGTPTDKRMKERERGKSKKRPVFVIYICLFRCCFSK
jgi:hypothetical protein